jgi:hypothetical protein
VKDQVPGFLDGARGKYRCEIIPMAAAAGRLKIVGLTREYASKSWTATRNIYYKAGEVGSAHIGNAFLF